VFSWLFVGMKCSARSCNVVKAYFTCTILQETYPRKMSWQLQLFVLLKFHFELFFHDKGSTSEQFICVIGR
jgi:hypothetical protein